MTNETRIDLRAAMRCEYTARLEDGGAFLLHPGEVYRIERSAPGGVYILTVAGEAFVPVSAFSWHEDCGPLCPTHGDPRDTSIDTVRLAVAR